MLKKLALSAVLLVFAAYAVSAQGATALDPTRISCGARILGLGRSFVGLADDIGSVYLNPSGISQLDSWQVTSMSGKLLEFSYLTLGGVYPTPYGNFGLAFSGSSIGGAYSTQIVPGTEGPDPLYELDLSQPVMNYQNNVFLLSYGNQFDKVPLVGERVAWFKNVDFGLNLKMFNTALVGDGIPSGDGIGTGMELDFGLLGKVNPWMKVGATASNFLPYTMGGKLAYATGHGESYPMVLRLGTSMKLLGKKDAWRNFAQDVNLLVDLENRPTTKNYPMIFHTGVEWRPINMIAIRAGIDQDVADDANGQIEVLNNFAAGVGLIYGNMRFDYAFHQFAGMVGASNQFFSLTFGVPVEQERKDLIEVYEPKDKTVTIEASTRVSGKIYRPARFVQVNGRPAAIDRRDIFNGELQLNIAKNKIKFEALNFEKKALDQKYARLCRLRTFPDVTADYWAVNQIGYIATLGIIEGYPNGTFKPQGTITRAELAAVLVRTLGATPEADKSYFSDVNLKHWAAKYIMTAADLKIIEGYPDGTFRPSGNLTRAEGLAMIARFSGVTPEASATPFLDVPRGYWAAAIIAGAHREGMLLFLQGQPFGPKRKLSRAEAVEMLFRSPYVQMMIKNDLLNWETY